MCRKRRKKRKINYFRICISIIIIIIILFLMTGAYKSISRLIPFGMGMERSYEKISAQLSDSDEQNILPLVEQEEINLSLLKGELHSPYSILVRLADQRIVSENRSEERIYPASLTKIMTAITAIENISDLKEPIILPKKIFSDLYAANASMVGFLPGEEVSAIDLLYGTMLPSGADASIGLAIGIAGSEKELAILMNKKAKEIGMNGTHFTNVTGLHDDHQYTTVKDVAMLLEYALKNGTFRQIFTSERHTTASTNLHSGGITFYSTLSKRIDTYEFDGGRIIGGKTGYTDKAGLCLASLAEKNGTEYILITVGAGGNPYTEQYHIVDAFMVYDSI
ncbi:D-alanyl-D-alanine carboxypeptidase family protein [Anoxynatronum buryatiense]|uniref:D-alanyl-D-alanine carboxypeptidase (Penicillin-binding protein 5/6) n=1 Tax=Anoxynatronum buryatiense TaxID=489973 RepID=A0AA46AJ23_9CLOT|nr:D-alanyl-D-alanine carboxypeptidase [Anoxynatronum buryatiense]SMP55967.1 D-alanyl-D-alanine carboxypeptidase (penicillin-binding protein 5/6) [Anoxynatronum buryatiense]